MRIIPIENLFVILLPIVVVWYFYKSWIKDSSEVLVATLRMVVQLFLMGYILTYLFQSDSNILGLIVLAVMIIASSVIALRNIKNRNFSTYKKIFFAITIGGTINLLLVIIFVLDLTPYYQPRYVIPLAGMIYANAMNAVSLAAERFEKEYLLTKDYKTSRADAFKASLIPQINAFLAVGFVALPGMMTGQILSGVEPEIAVRYQIMVMGMVIGSAGISVIVYLLQNSKNDSTFKSS